MYITKLIVYSSLIFLFSFCETETSGNQGNTTNTINVAGETIKNRITCPVGYTREDYPNNSWPYFLQNLHLLPDGAKVLDYSGRPISNQSSHVAVVDYDIGRQDLQQCADAIIRLRAEYLYQQQAYNSIQFKFTSGHNYKWTDHAQGIRPSIHGNNVSFGMRAGADNSYSNFRKYLNIIFTYAGTISLNRDLQKVDRNSSLQIGDIIIKAGSPGHAVLIVDRAQDAEGNYIYLLAQGYTPAQSIHVLKSGQTNISPWFKIDKAGAISSARYYFSNPNIRRF